jgi:hypothetical protein
VTNALGTGMEMRMKWGSLKSEEGVSRTHLERKEVRIVRLGGEVADCVCEVIEVFLWEVRVD